MQEHLEGRKGTRGLDLEGLDHCRNRSVIQFFHPSISI
jgi:hypothetical protein